MLTRMKKIEMNCNQTKTEQNILSCAKSVKVKQTLSGTFTWYFLHNVESWCGFYLNLSVSCLEF